MRAALLLLAAACLSAGEGAIAVRRCDPLVRTGAAFRAEIAAVPPSAAPCRVRVVLDHGGSAVEADAVLDPVQAQAGIAFALIPGPPAIAAADARLTATLLDRGGARLAETALDIPAASRIRADWLAAAAIAGPADDRAELWRGLAEEALAAPPSIAAVQRVAACADGLSALRRGLPPPAALSSLHPWRDPIDGGMRAVEILPGAGQPWIVIGPPGSADRLAGPRLIAPPAAAPWLARRLATLIPAGFPPGGIRPILVGVEDGAAAAIAWAEAHPLPAAQRISATLLLIDPALASGGAHDGPAPGTRPERLLGRTVLWMGRADAAAAAWLAAAGAVRVDDVAAALAADAVPQPLRPAAADAAPDPDRLAAYADAPFTVVVGTGEHAAAADDQRRLAEAFAAAWKAYAGAHPRIIDDTAPAPAGNLVCIGNPRSHRLLAGLARDLPVRWDHRAIALPGGRSLHRAERPPIALAVRRDGRLVVILDGAPAWPLAAGWRQGDLPLAGLPRAIAGGALPDPLTDRKER